MSRSHRELRTLAGELTTDEVRRANQDRKQLQRLAHDLFNAWIDFQNATSLGGEEAMFEAEKRLKHGVNALLSLASSTDHRRGIEYDEALLPIKAVLDRSDLHPFNKHNPLIPVLEKLARLEYEDRLWVLETRTLTPPAAPQSPTPTRDAGLIGNVGGRRL